MLETFFPLSLRGAQYAPHMRHVRPEYLLKGTSRPFLPTAPRQDFTGSAPLQTTIVHTMSRCSSFTKCIDSEASRACVGWQLHEDSRIVFASARFCDVEGTGPNAQCARKPPSLLLVLLGGGLLGRHQRCALLHHSRGSVDDHENATARMLGCRPARFCFCSPHCLGKLLLSLCDPST